MPKYLVSTSSARRLDSPNSTLLHGDVPGAVSNLKQQSTGDLVIMGSGQLIRSLMIHPLVTRLIWSSVYTQAYHVDTKVSSAPFDLRSRLGLDADHHPPSRVPLNARPCRCHAVSLPGQ